MNTTTTPTPNAAAIVVELSPTQVRGLKLAKDGDVFPQEGKRWTHLNATITYAKTDRFKERPQKVKFMTTITVEDLRGHGLIKVLNPDVPEGESPHGITMAGKIWLLKHK